LKLEWSYNDQITQIENPELEKINHKKFELENATEQFQLEKNQYDNLLQLKDSISRQIETSKTDYVKESLLAKLKKMDSKIEKIKPDDSKITTLRKELNFMLANLISELHLTGYITKIIVNHRQ
jgi:seryl-tRNA synthetase